MCPKDRTKNIRKYKTPLRVLKMASILNFSYCFAVSAVSFMNIFLAKGVCLILIDADWFY